MPDQPLTQKSVGAKALGAVYILRRNHQIAGLAVFFQAADGRERNQRFGAVLFQGEDVRAVIDLTRQEFMMVAMPRDKQNSVPLTRTFLKPLEALPNGVSQAKSSRVSNSSNFSKPEPPIIPNMTQILFLRAPAAMSFCM